MTAMRYVFARGSLALLAALAFPAHAAAAASNTSPELFAPIASVLLHPRCLNCHTSTGYPKQGDDRHPHRFRVVRGDDDRGAAGLRCATCHQSANNSTSRVPGAPNWHAAPLSMAWEAKTPRELCLVLIDRNRNGNRTIMELVTHMSDDPLVGWGWAPGSERQPVSLAKPDFVEALRRWAQAGAPCPK